MTGSAQLRELDALIEDLTLDAYSDEEQLSGFLVGAEEALRHEEAAQIVGVDVRNSDSQWSCTVLGLVVAAYRRWQGRNP